MPIVPPSTINDLPKSERAKAKRLMFERSVLQYRFSFERLMEHMSADELKSCALAYNEDEEKAVKSDLNDQLITIFTNNGIEKTLRFEDPFGTAKDYMAYEGTSVSFSQSRALPIIVAGIFQWSCPKCHKENYTVSTTDVKCACKAEFKKVKPSGKHSMPAEAIQAAFAAATVTGTYTTFQARDVREGKNGSK